MVRCEPSFSLAAFPQNPREEEAIAPGELRLRPPHSGSSCTTAMSPSRNLVSKASGQVGQSDGDRRQSQI